MTRAEFLKANDSIMKTYSKQTNSLLHSETLPIGNCLIDIKTQLRGRSNYAKDGSTPKKFDFL